jgi:hypothetical protein
MHGCRHLNTPDFNSKSVSLSSIRQDSNTLKKLFQVRRIRCTDEMLRSVIICSADTASKMVCCFRLKIRIIKGARK